MISFPGTSYWSAQTPDGDHLSIGDALHEAAARWPDADALIEGGDPDGRRWTFAQLLTDARHAAQALLTAFHPGDRVAVWSTNRPEWIVLQFGAALAGLTLVTVNPAYGEVELRHVLAQSRSNGLFFEPTIRGRSRLGVVNSVRETLPDLGVVVSLADWAQFTRATAGGPDRLPAVAPRSPAQIQYTSGTTGMSKGALLAHCGLVLSGRSYAHAIGAGAGDVWINPMPLFHTAGCGLVTLGALQTGGCQVLPPTFDADLMLDLFERYRGTIMLSVPTMLIRMLDAQRDRPRDVTSWRLTTLGGAPVPVELVHRAEREIAVAVGIGFGQTESSPYITHTVPDDPAPESYETVGRPLGWAEVKIADAASNQAVPLGSPGEICVRGECVMLGYFDDAAATAQAIDPDGWLHTGDIATMDRRGYLRVSGRLKDLIIRGGENVYPREIEDVLYGHPAVADVAVVGIPDDHWGEVVAAFVRPRGETTIDISDLETFCRSRVATYKVPRIWQLVAELPQTASGKIQKYVLRDAYLAGHSPDAGNSD